MTCLGFQTMSGDYDCAYKPTIDCQQCKYGGAGGKKDPEAGRKRRQSRGAHLSIK